MVLPWRRTPGAESHVALSCDSYVHISNGTGDSEPLPDQQACIVVTGGAVSRWAAGVDHIWRSAVADDRASPGSGRLIGDLPAKHL